MKSVKLKGETIPPIALGTWSWGNGVNGGDTVFGNNLSDEDLKPVFDAAMDAGFNLWDTAAVYGMGASETILGNFIKEREDVLVSTKFTPGAHEAMEDTLNDSFERLGVDHADIYWIHNPNDVEKWTAELIPLMKNGKIKHAGVSNHNLEEVKLAASILEKEGLKLPAVQNHYSLLYRASEDAGIIDWCNEHDVLFFSYMVLEQGALTGKYTAQNPFKADTRRGKAFSPDVLKKLTPLLEKMKNTAEKHQVDTAQIAMAWAIAKGTVPIIGVTKSSHVDGAIAAANVELSDQEVKSLETAAKETGVEVKAEWEQEM
ncbi:aldo/keto reductase [Sediminibacillus sp. JSM 1682029]|uniref:aldo/keto reductase n=1 Tax=Sediminibacillus sp. JSM 1682029 TaxID=3229857 RepID=UPI003525752C